MPQTNNFNRSTTGFNITCNAHYDEWLSQEYFKDYMTKIADDVYVYTGLDGTPRDFDLQDYIKIKGLKKDMEDYMYKYGLGFRLEDGLKKDEIVEFLYEDLDDELDKWRGFSIAHDMDRTLERFASHNITLELDFEAFTSRGYSQGDAVSIIVPKEYGVCDEFKEYIHHLLWDCPINGVVHVNDEEFFVEEFLDDEYTWDKQKVVAGIIGSDYFVGRDKFDMKIIEEELNDVIPEELDYS